MGLRIDNREVVDGLRRAKALRRVPARPVGTIVVEIVGTDLPGIRCGPDQNGAWCEGVHVGLARGSETVELIRGDAPIATWAFSVSIRADESGDLDFGGPFVIGRRGERHLGIRWLRQDARGGFVVFRGAKIRLYEMDAALFRTALGTGQSLVGRLGLTDADGWPRCATVRPPDISWSVA
jgi:hypothetical protein